MNSSILARLRWSYIGFGVTVALVFPVYAQFFVDWKPGMFVWFVVGCVVADEVRKLAEKTTAATGEIESVLALIRGRIEAAVDKSGDSLRQMSETRRLSEDTGTALDQIVDSIAGLTREIGNVAEMASDQQTISTVVLDRIQENEENTDEAARRAGACTNTCKDLAELSRDLMAEVSKFRLAT
ncbi:Methyl-accepting chemotaxis protein 4 [Rhodocyclaceae bacterium]|nr:Methyl-accepting chemotaxis protein 4 [Rhodocyclaceae bacterium]